ncbi:MAG: YitT family protein [Clostridia bacterium]|nr:YitT family protein [Clostridia bacterium]
MTAKMSKLKILMFTLIGTFLTSIGVSVFYLPAKVVGGGVSGLATVIYHTLGIQPGITYGVINIALLIVAIFILGKHFVIHTLVGAFSLTLFVELLSYVPPITDDVVLATICGSVFYGVGIGITLLVGASTGGTDIAARLIQHYRPNVAIGRLLLFVDSAVILLSLIVFREFELALYGIIALAVSTFAIDFLISKMNVSKLAFVITSKGGEISRLLVTTSQRGVTLIDAKGAYTGGERQVLICALKETEIPAFQHKIEEIDENVFIIYSESQQIVGNGFHVYR